MEAAKIESLSSAIFSMQQEIASLKALITVQQGQIDALNIRVASLEDTQRHGSHPPPQQRPSRPQQRNQRQQPRDQQRPQRRGLPHSRADQTPRETTERHRIEFPRPEEQPINGSTAEEWENPQEWE